MAHVVERPAVDSGSDQELAFRGFEPHDQARCCQRRACIGSSVPHLSLRPSTAHAVSKINTKQFKTHTHTNKY